MIINFMDAHVCDSPPVTIKMENAFNLQTCLLFNNNDLQEDRDVCCGTAVCEAKRFGAKNGLSLQTFKGDLSTRTWCNFAGI